MAEIVLLPKPNQEYIMLTENNLTKQMTLVERDRALHEQFKAAAEALRSCLNELCDEIIPTMEGDSSSCVFFEPGMPTFIAPLYSLADDESDLTRCALIATAAFHEMKEAHDAMGAVVQELRELRKNPKQS